MIVTAAIVAERAANVRTPQSAISRGATRRALDNDQSGGVSFGEIKEHLDALLIRADIIGGRLTFEKDMCSMMSKLPMFIISFACFLAALIELAPAANAYNVHRHLKHHFSLDMESLGNIKDIEAIYTYMEQFENKNEELQATSAKYWCEHRYSEHHWDEKLAVPVITCKSPRQYALSLTKDSSSAWTAPMNNSVQLHTRHLAGVPACDDYDEELQKKTGDMNTTCVLAAVDSHHKICEEDLGILLCPKTCGFCSPFTYDHKKDFTKPQVTMLPISVFQTRFAVSDCHGFARTYELQPPNPVLRLLPALDGTRNGRVLTCVNRNKHAETQYSHEKPCPLTAPPSQCPDGKLRYSHKRTYHGTTVYAKMLIEPHRDVEAMKAIQWLDLQTESIALSTLVYTEDIELFTLLEVKFQVDVAGNIDGRYTMISYRDMVGQTRVVFIACLSVCMAVSVINLSFMAYDFFQRGLEINWGSLSYELFSRVVMLAYPAILLITWSLQVPMADEYGQLLYTFLDIEGMSESHIDGTMDSYFEVLSHVYAETSWLLAHRIAGYLVTYSQFLQLIFYMNAHPKLASLVATLRRALDNLLHFMVLFVFIFVMLAFMAHWMLGEHIEEFGSYKKALFSQMQMFFGEFIKVPDADELHGALQVMYWVYAWTFMLVIWLLLLNFLLAIIVDAFVEVKDKFKNMVFVADVATDVATVCHSRITALRYRWPSHRNLIEFFERVIEDACDEPKKIGRVATGSTKSPRTSVFNALVTDEDENDAPEPVCRAFQMMATFLEFQTEDAFTRFVLHYYKLCPDAVEVSDAVENSCEPEEVNPEIADRDASGSISDTDFL